MPNRFELWYEDKKSELFALAVNGEMVEAIRMAWNAASKLEPLVTSAEISKQLNVSQRHFIERISKTKGFPLPVTPSVWTVREVNNWINRNKGATK
jgi:hypothetical protein